MRARPGDTIVAHGNKVGATERVGRIVEARGPSGAPPFVVAWDDTEATCLVFPGADAEVRPPRDDPSKSPASPPPPGI
jgi:uncharacterized protein DUF1918